MFYSYIVIVQLHNVLDIPFLTPRRHYKSAEYLNRLRPC